MSRKTQTNAIIWTSTAIITGVQLFCNYQQKKLDATIAGLDSKKPASFKITVPANALQ